MQCRIFDEYWNEVVSLVEQAVIEKSVNFYYWPLSTWSERILDLRTYQNPEEPHYWDIIDKMAEIRVQQKHPNVL